MATLIFVSGNRTFEITLSSTSRSGSPWTVEHVYDKSLNSETQIPRMDSILAMTEEAAFARACDCIEKSLRSKP